MHDFLAKTLDGSISYSITQRHKNVCLSFCDLEAGSVDSDGSLIQLMILAATNDHCLET